jgi:protein TonB
MARLLTFAFSFSLFLAIPTFSQTKSRESQLPRPGVNGVTKPDCTYCPVPDYTDQARREKIQGVVVVQAMVTAVGRAEHISVLRGLGAGLDEKAIEIVQSWRFKPARDAAGHPVAVSVPMEVTFHLD